MKKILILMIIFIIPFTVKANSIKSIEMDIYVDENGTAHVTERWSAKITEGTEGYKPYYNLGTSVISNYHVTMNDSEEFTFIDKWNVKGTFSDKAYKNGINYLKDGVELCFGISNYGKNNYTLTYDISNFVVNLKDSQMLYWTLVPYDFSSEPDSVKIKIYSDFAYENSLDVWGYGQYGAPCYVSGGVIEMISNGPLQSDEYMTILVKFPQNTFNLDTSIDKQFDYYLDMASVGADVYKEEDDEVWYAIFPVIFFCIFTPIIVATSKKNSFYGSHRLDFGKTGRKMAKDTPYYRDIPYRKDELARGYWIASQYNMIKNKTDFLGAILLKWYKDGNITITKKINEKKNKEELYIVLNNCANISSSEVNLYRMMYEASTNGILGKKEFEKYCRRKYEKIIKWFDEVIDEETDKMVSEGLININGKKYEVFSSLYDEAKKVYGLKKFLEDFSKIEDRSSFEVQIWEEYLMYAQIFGIAKKVMKEFKDMYPNIITDELNTNMNFIYLLSYSGMQSANSAGGYSAGGGGFSSGGGGGGSFGGGGGGGGFR